MSDKQKKIGLKILELRRLRGLSQTELAEKIGIKQKKLSNIERGYYKNIDLEVLEKIADFFNVPIEFFLGTDNEKTGLFVVETLEEDKQEKENLILEYLKLNDKNKDDLKRMKQILKKLLLLVEKAEKNQS